MKYHHYWNSEDDEVTSQLIARARLGSKEALNLLLELVISPLQRICGKMFHDLGCRLIDGDELACVIHLMFQTRCVF